MDEQERVANLLYNYGDNGRRLESRLQGLSRESTIRHLVNIMDDGRAAPRSLWFWLFPIGLIAWSASHDKGQDWVVAAGLFLPIIMIVSVCTLAQRIQKRECRHRAAFLLAELDHPRAVVAMAQDWESRAAPNDVQNQKRESELTRLATRYSEQEALPNIAHAFRSLLQRLVTAWRQDARRGAFFDLNDTRTDMVLALIRYLAHSGTAEDMVVLKEVAELPLPRTAANREVVKTTATLALEPSPLPLLDANTRPSETPPLLLRQGAGR